MFESVEPVHLVRNLGVYAIGVFVAVVGAIGLIDVIDVPTAAAGALFVFGLVIVLAVHEYLDGPF
jgi:hypothetical protein